MNLLARPLGAFMRETLIKKDGKRTMTPMWQGLCTRNENKVSDQKTIFYNLMCTRTKIWANILNKSVIHKARSKTSLSNLYKFMLFHLMENLPFDLPHTI